MGKFSRLGNSLYDGTTSIDFVGRRWIWYSVSLVIIALATAGLFVKGLNFGIEFEGGVEYTVSLQSSQVTQGNVDKIRDAVAGTGIDEASSPIVNTSGDKRIRVQTEEMSNDDASRIRQTIADTVDVNPRSDISVSEVGASWGEQVINRSITGLVVFLFAVLLFIWAYFREWKMSVGAIVALAHDIIITVGIYAWSGFEVTPATVTGVLTILGFSLYDTVVVFDKVRENTKDTRKSRRTYAELANLAVNQTLVRSINTTIVALLPVAALLYVGVFTLGSGALKDLSLALFVGMAAGAYSSIFIATPFAVHLKEGEKEISEADRRARARARRDADRYADVPVFAHDMPVVPEPGDTLTEERDVDVDDEPARGDGTPFRAPGSRPSALGSGRVVPQKKAPVERSGSSGRNQPSRKPRSRRGK
jgi:preprotein translocase subunit SecF